MKTNWKLIAKVFAGEANERELHDFETWSQQNGKNKQLIDMLKKNWDSVKQPDELIDVDVDRAWTKLHGRLESEQLIPGKNARAGEDPGRAGTRLLYSQTVRIAASLALIIAIGTASYMIFRPGEQSTRMTASTQEQQNFGLQLPDGSDVDMNTNTRLTYKLQRSGTRIVTLEGEAWFDVAHNGDRPFIIHAGNGIIEVTGTSFSVRTVPGGQRIEVYVESGNVQFYRTRKQDRILSLKAGQMGVLEQNRLSRESAPGPNHFSWKTRKLTFRDTRLGDVAGILNRTYSQNIRFSSESLEDCLFTGTFDQQPIDSVVRVIQVAFDFEMERDGKAYVFSGDGCN